MSVFPLIRLLRCSFLAASLRSCSMAASTTSLSSALSKKVPAYSRMFSGRSSKIFLTKSPSKLLISGCYLKYFSFSILSSSCSRVCVKGEVAVMTYLFLLYFVLLSPHNTLNSDKIMIVVVKGRVSSSSAAFGGSLASELVAIVLLICCSFAHFLSYILITFIMGLSLIHI